MLGPGHYSPGRHYVWGPAKIVAAKNIVARKTIVACPPKKQNSEIICQDFPCALDDLFIHTSKIDQMSEVMIFEITPINHSSSYFVSHTSQFYLSWLSPSWYKQNRKQLGFVYETKVGKSYINTLSD